TPILIGRHAAGARLDMCARDGDISGQSGSVVVIHGSKLEIRIIIEDGFTADKGGLLTALLIRRACFIHAFALDIILVIVCDDVTGREAREPYAGVTGA